jgi:hypothetical protein
MGTPIECGVTYITDEQFFQFHKPVAIANGEHRLDLTVTGSNRYERRFSLVTTVPFNERISWRHIGIKT